MARTVKCTASGAPVGQCPGPAKPITSAVTAANLDTLSGSGMNTTDIPHRPPSTGGVSR